MIFIKDSHGKIIGEIVDEGKDEMGCCLTMVVIALILVASFVAAIGALPEFIGFYLQEVYTYLIAVGIIAVNILLFYNNCPIVTVIEIEAIIFAIILFLHNMCSDSSYWNFVNEYSSVGMVYIVLTLAGMIWQCVLGAALLCVICSIVSGICTLILEEKKQKKTNN